MPGETIELERQLSEHKIIRNVLRVLGGVLLVATLAMNAEQISDGTFDEGTVLFDTAMAVGLATGIPEDRESSRQIRDLKDELAGQQG